MVNNRRGVNYIVIVIVMIKFCQVIFQVIVIVFWITAGLFCVSFTKTMAKTTKAMKTMCKTTKAMKPGTVYTNNCIGSLYNLVSRSSSKETF